MSATSVCCGGPMVRRGGIDYDTGEKLVRDVCPKCGAVTEWRELSLTVEHYEDGRVAVLES